MNSWQNYTLQTVLVHCLTSHSKIKKNLLFLRLYDKIIRIVIFHYDN